MDEAEKHVPCALCEDLGGTNGQTCAQKLNFSDQYHRPVRTVRTPCSEIAAARWVRLVPDRQMMSGKVKIEACFCVCIAHQVPTPMTAMRIRMHTADGSCDLNAAVENFLPNWMEVQEFLEATISMYPIK